MTAETQVGGFVDDRDVAAIDWMVAETSTSRIAVIRAMIRCCLADPDAFLAEWMPPLPERTWEIGGDPYTAKARMARWLEEQSA